jgi:hypothetical protein
LRLRRANHLRQSGLPRGTTRASVYRTAPRLAVGFSPACANSPADDDRSTLGHDTVRAGGRRA